MTSDAGLLTVDVEPSDVVLVNPRMLIAWESCLNPAPLSSNKYVPPQILLESKNDAVALKYLKKFGLFMYSIGRNSIIFARNSILGTPVEYYSIKGPGKYIMATQRPNRVMSRLLKV